MLFLSYNCEYKKSMLQYNRKKINYKKKSNKKLETFFNYHLNEKD